MNCNCEAIKKLQDEINELKILLNKNIAKIAGFKDDEIFLLSVKEYEKYKNTIPNINIWWWLRSPGYTSDNAAVIDYVSSIKHCGIDVRHNYGAVRPVLRLSNQESEDIKIGDIFIKYKFPWIKIDDNLAIAEMPIAYHRFDEKSNDYENSEIRQYLLDWVKERK